MRKLKIFDENGNELNIEDVVANFIIDKSKEFECDLDQVSISVQDNKIVVSGFYYLEQGEQFHKEIEIPFTELHT